jgi:glycosyltransferase involved in cell wall biosynthesis
VGTERGWRGGERQTLWLAQGLAILGDTNVIAARAREPLAVRAEAAGILVVAVEPAFEGDPRAAWRLRQAIRTHRIDVVHAHTAHAITLGAMATLGSRVPVVAARRVDFPLRDNRGTRWKYGRCAAVIAVSHAVADVVGRSALPVPVHVVPDGTDVRRHRDPADAATLATLGVPRGAPLVVQVAQLVDHKDPLTFVRAVAAASTRMPRLHALLVGDGPLRSIVEQAVRELGLEDVLHLTGYRTDADRLLAAADVVTLSSKEEGMGSVLLDALVFSRPVAATRAGGIPEVVHDGETGILVPVGDAEALGAAVVTLLTDRSLALRMGAAGRARAPEFSIEAMAMRTREVYESLELLSS